MLTRISMFHKVEDMVIVYGISFEDKHACQIRRKIKRVCETEMAIVSQCCQPKHASRIIGQKGDGHQVLFSGYLVLLFILMGICCIMRPRPSFETLLPCPEFTSLVKLHKLQNNIVMGGPNWKRSAPALGMALFSFTRCARSLVALFLTRGFETGIRQKWHTETNFPPLSSPGYTFENTQQLNTGFSH